MKPRSAVISDFIFNIKCGHVIKIPVSFLCIWPLLFQLLEGTVSLCSLLPNISAECLTPGRFHEHKRVMHNAVNGLDSMYPSPLPPF